MQYRAMLLALGASWFFVPGAAHAIVIEFDGKRIAGYLEKEDTAEITVRIKGKDKPGVYERSKIKIIHKVDRARLEKLSKDNPKGYRDFAAVLAGHKYDPEARDLALRLYVIAAYLDTPNLGRSCLMGMSDVASDPAEARKYRAMAYVLEAKGDLSLLKSEPAKKVAPKPAPAVKPPTGLNDFQKALRYYRSGMLTQVKDAGTIYASKPGVADIFRKAPGLVQKDFIKACNDAVCSKCRAGNATCTTCNGMGTVVAPGGFGFQPCGTCNGKKTKKCTTCDGFGLNTYSDEYLEVILRAELWAVDQVLAHDPPQTKTTGDLSWSRALADQPAGPAPLLRLETITPFNPRECVYRDGKWIAP